MKNFVTHCLKTFSHRFHAAELINLATVYKISALFHDAFHQLTELPITQITKEHWELMGIPVFIHLVYVKAVLDGHCHIVAAEEPQISAHADDCQYPKACEEDWHAAWWNGMGRFLLDGRNPQPYRDATKRFKEMSFGQVNEKCKMLIFHTIDEGHAFNAVDCLITDICDHLVQQLHLAS